LGFFAGSGDTLARVERPRPSSRLRLAPLFGFVALAALTAVSGCTDDVIVPPAPSFEAIAIYGAATETMLTPYPSNRYAVADAATATGLRVRVSPETTADPIASSFGSVGEQLNEMDGFSTAGGVVVMFTGPIDLRGITSDPLADPPELEPPRDADDYKNPGSPLVLVNVDPNSPARGTAHGLVPRFWAQAKDSYYTTDEFTLIAQPATPLLPGTRYAFAVTSGLKSKGGGAVLRSPSMDALLRGEGDDPYTKEVQAALVELESSPVAVKEPDIVLLTTFTTASILTPTIAMAKAARASAVPALLEPWSVETPLEGDGRVRFRGVYEAPEYRKPAPDGQWQIEGGAPVVQKKVGLEVFLAFADGTKSGPRPVVIYGHGLGGDKDGSWGTAGRLADINAAVIAIDSPEHGSRSVGETNVLTSSFAFFGIDPDTQSFDIRRARDNFRQMASDQLELVRFLSSLGELDLLPPGAPDGVPDLDVSRALYIGHSFGSVQGPTALALAPEISHAVWNVGGDGLTTLLRDSGTFSILVNSLRPPGTPDGAVARFFAVAQAIVDPGDPLNYARFGTLEAMEGVPDWAPRDVLLQEVIDDHIVPNSTSEALARAAGLELIDAIRPISGVKSVPGPVMSNLPSGSTGAISQFDLMDGTEVATHGDLIFSPEARAQYVEFFKTGLSSPRAKVVSPYPK
jgi:hypothetical protein